jgi:LPXTG-motif cell wall-anchored protein
MTKSNLLPHPIVSVPPASTNDIRAIKAPVEIPNTWVWVWVTLGVLALAALAWWFWRKRRQKQSTPTPVVIIPPHERARAKLQEALALLDQPRPFCILVSDTIRVYLEERFLLRAPERTTEEFLEELQSSALLSLEQKQTLGEFLTRCDLVKFARYEPGPAELQGIYEIAVRLVDETQPAPIPAEPAGATKAPAS